VRLKRFQEGTHDELLATLAKVRAESKASFSGIVLDMRGNPGGLVDEAAEIVAGSLQDNHRATIVGAPTFGKGSVQTILELPGGAGLKLTTMRYYTPSGHSIQAQGIQPDILVESSRTTAEIGR